MFEGFDKVYSVEGFPSVAFRATNYKEIYDEDYEWTGIVELDYDYVVAHMIGDDKDFILDIEELTPTEDYCPECGQIGCEAYVD